MIKKLREKLKKLASPNKAKVYQRFFKTGKNASLRNRTVFPKSPKELFTKRNMQRVEYF